MICKSLKINSKCDVCNCKYSSVCVFKLKVNLIVPKDTLIKGKTGTYPLHYIYWHKQAGYWYVWLHRPNNTFEHVPLSKVKQDNPNIDFMLYTNPLKLFIREPVIQTNSTICRKPIY